ncbi:hypothetical protein [Ruminococcus bromii]|uniref:hypothetical protein n=1 Tax=Ruminococcus bromii TaxID=40518 RepID=UPI00266D419E|nr:hypothetical protein [Ruminococcus bromii]
MKKLLSILIAVMMCCAVTVTAFAATPDEAPAKDMQAIIKQAMLDNYYTDTKPTELEIRIVGGNENGSVYFEHTDNLSYTSAAYETQLGNYTYSYTAADELLVYNNGKIYTMKNAYESGIINDEDVADIDEWNDSFYREAPAYDIKAAIEKAMLETYYLDVKPSHIEIYIVGSTSDDGVYFKYNDGLPRADVMIEAILGEFGYRTAESEKTLLYKDGKIYSIPSAYNSGVIDDDILTELVDFNIGVMRRYYTVELPSAPPADAKSSSTSDTATKDTPSNSQNNSGAVQTGQNSVAIFLATAMLAGCGVIFAKRRTRFE